MENNEVIASMINIEKGKAQRKIDYWQTAGKAILDENELSEKWCAFVEQQANDDFTRGVLLDETLQIMTMIKSNMPFEIIAQTIKKIPNGQTIIDDYLGAFIHPEILYEIQSQMNSRIL